MTTQTHWLARRASGSNLSFHFGRAAGPIVLALAATAALVWLPGCSTQRPALEAEPAAESRAADALANEGKFADAAVAYQALAAQGGPQSSHYRLLAAESFYRAGNRSDAQQLAEQLARESLTDADRQRLGLLSAQLALDRNDAKSALRFLDNLGGPPSEQNMATGYHRLRSVALAQLNHPFDSVRERIALGVYLQGEPAARNKQMIISTLFKVPDKTLKAWPSNPPDILSGWVDLAKLLRAHPAGSSALAGAMNTWRTQYPDHPADADFLKTYLPAGASATQPLPDAAASPGASAAGDAMFGEGKFVAVLLPLSGKLGPAGEAVRMGLVSAYYELADRRTSLRFFDTEGTDIVELYQKVVRTGSEYVIGPLVKKEVESLAQVAELPVPILALNQLNDLSRDNLYQFGLTPEDELEQAASSAWLDGRQNALLLAPATDFGQRLTGHFREYWRGVGGKLLGVTTYVPGGRNLPDSLRGLLTQGGLAPGQAASPTAADFLFIVADNRDARLIHTQLESFQMGSLPVYTTSHVYGGSPEASANRDLAGYVFCDAPWLISQAGNESLSQANLEAAWSKLPSDYLRLVAMGIDAYALVFQLNELIANPGSRYRGATGALSLGAGNRIKRQLDCAQFDGGTLRVRGPAPQLQSTPPASGVANPV